MDSRLKTVFLLALLTALFVWLGNILGGTTGMTYALIFALVLNFFSYWFSDRIVLGIYRAKEVSESEAPELHAIVRELTQKAGLPKPRVYIIPTDHPNAFATGRDPQHSAVAVTQGILKLLDPRELRGVLSHEIAHIKNRDILIQSVVAVIAGAITYLAYMARWAFIFGGWGRDDDRGGNPFAMLIIAIFAPIAATLIHLAISRVREYAADHSGALLSRDPIALANALAKLSYGTAKIPLNQTNPSTAHIFIVSPLRGGSFANLFSTHPPVEERIERLRALARSMGVV